MVGRIFKFLTCAIFVLLVCALASSCAKAWEPSEETGLLGTTHTLSESCKHAFGAYEYPEDADCRSSCVAFAECRLCGTKEYKNIERGPHRFAENNLCVYCGKLDMKSGVEYREGDFIFIRHGENLCEAKLAEDAMVENVIFPSSYGGYDVVMISMANSDTVRRAVKHVFIPAGVETTAVYAFKNCTSLESVSIEKGCKLAAIGYETFAGCSALKSIELENCAELAEVGARAFASCSALEQITLPQTVNKIEERAFTGCSSLNKINLQSEYVSLGVGVFLDCVSLSNVNFLNKVDTIPGSAFSGCTGLGRIRIPDNVKYIEDYAFEKSGVVEVALPQSLLTLGNMAFFECKSLERIEIYDGISVIRTSTFSGCKSLREIVLPSTLEQISAYAFSDCTSLESIVIPESVSSIAANAFYLDHALCEAIFERTDRWESGGATIEEATIADPALAAALLKEGYTGDALWRDPSTN